MPEIWLFGPEAGAPHEIGYCDTREAAQVRAEAQWCIDTERAAGALPRAAFTWEPVEWLDGALELRALGRLTGTIVRPAEVLGMPDQDDRAVPRHPVRA